MSGRAGRRARQPHVIVRSAADPQQRHLLGRAPAAGPVPGNPVDRRKVGQDERSPAERAGRHLQAAHRHPGERLHRQQAAEDPRQRQNAEGDAGQVVPPHPACIRNARPTAAWSPPPELRQAEQQAGRRGRVVARGDARHRLYRVAEPLIAARFHDRAGDHVDRGRNVDGAQPQAAAAVRFLGERQLAAHTGYLHALLELPDRQSQVEVDRDSRGHRDARRQRRETLPRDGQAIVAGGNIVDAERAVRSGGNRQPELLERDDRRRQRRAAPFIDNRPLHRAGRLAVRRTRRQQCGGCHHDREQTDPAVHAPSVHSST